MKPKAPCLNCPERHGGCWAGCDKYLRFREDNEAYKQNVMKKKDDTAMLNSFAINRWRRSHNIKEKER